MPQIPTEKTDSSRMIVKVDDKNFQLEIDDKDSLEAAIAVLNLLAKKFKLKIKSESSA
ncbi:MAG: hypothetical protein M3146_10055 [Thermoproteota archaeon]|nr:hypothetical protein [Thermoproteota archaeon]